MNEMNEMTGKGWGCGQRGRKRWFLLPLIPICAILFFGFIVMLLWNGLMPEIFKLEHITYWQAVGLLILAKILFVLGPFRKGGFGEHRRHWAWKERWMKMTDEERAKFKEEWKNRGRDCGC